MATASSRKPGGIPAPVVGKLKAPSKSVGSINAVGKNKTTKSLKVSPNSESSIIFLGEMDDVMESMKSQPVSTRLASSTMTSSEKHLPISARTTGLQGTDEENGSTITSESLGSLVCIGETQVGILRYFGQTHFETGLWCGVECAEAVGKNDGSVMGTRYFTCKEKYGIFAPLSKVSLVDKQSATLCKENSGISKTKPKETSANTEQSELQNRPKTLGTMISNGTNPNSKPANDDGVLVAPATTPVTATDDSFIASLGIKRLKKDIKRGKDSNSRLNQQLKKKRKLDSSQKQIWSGTTSPSPNNNKCTPPNSTTASVMSHDVDLPNLLTVKLKEEIIGGSFDCTPVKTPPVSYREAFSRQHLPSTSTPIENQSSKVPKSRLDRLRYDKFETYQGTPKSSRGYSSKLSPSESEKQEGKADCDQKSWQNSASTSSSSPTEVNYGITPNSLPDSSGPSQVAPNADTCNPDETIQLEDSNFSPVSSSKDEAGSEVINLEAFPAKRPSSISLFPGFSSEESSEQGIFGVSTPELIGGDSASLPLSMPTSCCSSPEVLDNESSLGLLTPSHLQECWNSNTNDEDLYQHLRSPSVDDLEEFEEEDKTVDQDLSEQAGSTTDNFRVMSNSLNGTLVVNENDGLVSVRHPMHHSLHEELHHTLHPSQGRVRRDQTYTQLPTVPNLNQQQRYHHHHHHHHQHHPSHQFVAQQPSQPNKMYHAPLSFRGSGSGSGSGYCASDPFTDSDFNTESEADHDHDEITSASNGGSSSVTTSSIAMINSTSMKNRSARVIDGALYTSHHHNLASSQTDRNSPSTLSQHHHHNHHHQHQQHSKDTGAGGSIDGVGKCIDMASSISVSVSSTSASACASEMESSGFYSDASERNPSGGSVMSESDGYRSSRHLSKSSSDCDDPLAHNMGLKMAPLKPLTQSEDDSIQILEASSIYDDDADDMSSFEASSLATDNSFNTHTTKASMSSIQTVTEAHYEAELSPKKLGIGKTNPENTVEYRQGRGENNEKEAQRMMSFFERSDEELDLCEDMDIDLFAEYDEQEMETMNNNNTRQSEADAVCPSKDAVGLDFTEAINMTKLSPQHGLTPNGEKKDQGLSVVPDVLGASHEEMDLEVSPKASQTLSIGASPLSSPMTNTAVVSHHGNVFIDGEIIADLLPGAIGGGSGSGGGISLRSQSFNCIASLTSSTASSASTVTAKSCVTPAGSSTGTTTSTASTTRGRKSIPGSTQIGFRSKIPSIEHIPLMCDAAKDHPKGKGKVGVSSQAKKGKAGANIRDGANEGKKNSTTAVTLSSVTNSNSSVTALSALSSVDAAEQQQSCVVSTTTGGATSSGNSNRRPSRVSTTNLKSATGPRKALNNNNTLGENHKANVSTASISSSTDLNRTNRSLKASNLNGSTRSLASVGLASSPSTAACKASQAAKKINKWDAVMSKIAETKHKTINVKDVKSKVFNSGKSTGGGAGTGSDSTSTINHGQTSLVNGKMVKGVKSASRLTLADRGNTENDPLVPPAIHRRQQHHFSSRSSTVSDSSLDDQPQRGPPAKHRVKKDAPINRRQVSDLSSASDYSATHSQAACGASSLSKTMTTGSTRRPQRNNTNANSTSSGGTGTKTTSSSGGSTSTTKATNTSAKSQGTKGAQALDANKKKGITATQTTTTTARGTIAKSKVGSSTVPSSQQDPSSKSHPALKPLRDRNRLGPVGKNYGAPGLDANANESEATLLRPPHQANGELEPTTKSRTKVPGSAEPLIDSNVAANNNTSNLIIKSKSANNRVSSTNQQNIQNSVILQENSSLKEEVCRLSSVVSDLQEQISKLTASGEESKKTLEGCIEKADTSIAALTIVAQQCDKERQEVYEQLIQQQTENKLWKQRLDEKLAELQKLQGEYEKEREHNQAELRTLQENHEIEVDVTVRNCEQKLEQMQKRHDETLAELKRSHTEELERLQETQRQELEQTIQKHRELLDQHRNQSPHDILHKEVESLQVVVDMRNEEIRVLRKDLMDYKNTLNDLQMAREHGKSLLAKIEDLEAQLEKARSDKRGLQERYQALEANLQQVESDNNRLVRCNEELTWKMKSYNLVEN